MLVRYRSTTPPRLDVLVGIPKYHAHEVEVLVGIPMYITAPIRFDVLVGIS